MRPSTANDATRTPTWLLGDLWRRPPAAPNLPRRFRLLRRRNLHVLSHPVTQKAISHEQKTEWLGLMKLVFYSDNHSWQHTQRNEKISKASSSMPIIPRPTMLAETKLGVIYSHLPVPPPACAEAVEVAAPSGMDARKRGGAPGAAWKGHPASLRKGIMVSHPIAAAAAVVTRRGWRRRESYMKRKKREREKMD